MAVQKKRLEELNLMDQFLFDRAMEDEEISRLMLEIILDEDNLQLSIVETEKEIRSSEYRRGIRLDLFAVNAYDRSVYNTELQKRNTKSIPRRSRYYHAVIDSSLLDPGVLSFNQLPDSCLIFIMPFDLFGKGKYRYMFHMGCEEIPGLTMKDGGTRVFLNTRGTNASEVSAELVQLLHYVEHTTAAVAEQSGTKVQAIHERIQKLKNNEEIGVKYMLSMEEKFELKEEGRAEGELTKLIDQIRKKMNRKQSIAQIAEDLIEEESLIEKIYNTITENPTLDTEDILEKTDLLPDEYDY